MAPPSQPEPDVEALLAHSRYVRALARELVFDAALARDVEQETWLAALDQAPRDPRALRGWLAALVRNIALKAWRSADRRRNRELEHARVERGAPTPADVAEREELRRRLVEAVNSLEEPYRSVLVLRFLEGLEPPAVARRLEVSLETVRTRQKRALERLRARLDRASHGERGAWCLLLVRGFRLAPPGPAAVAAAVLSSFLGVSGVLVMSLIAASGLFLLLRSAGPVEPAPAASSPTSALPLAITEPWPIVPVVVPGMARVPLAGPAPAPEGDESEDLVKVSGRVLDPDGKPLPGAEVYLTRWFWDEDLARDPLASARADAGGRFAFSYSKSDRRLALNAERPEMWRHVVVSAFAPGFGPAWLGVRDLAEGSEAVLQLVRDVAVRGRVLDLDGQPVAGARLCVCYVSAGAAPESLDEFLEDPRSNGRLLARSLQLPPEREIACVTGADGAFELRGIGRERRVSIDLSGPTIVQTLLLAVTRPIETITWDAGDMVSMNQTLHGSEFDWIAPPTRPVTGIVRDASTRKPLAGVKITSLTMTGVNYQTTIVSTTTGADGSFRLVGMPKGPDNSICVVPNDEQPYFQQELPVPDPAGIAPIEVEIELHRGIWISGRLTVRGTGKPAYGRIHYLPYLDNPHAQKLAEFDPYHVHGDQTRYKTDADGRFRIVGLPGRAIVGVTAIGDYRQGAGAEEIEGADGDGEFKTYSNPLPASLRWPTSMRAVEIPVEASASVCDLELDRGDSLVVELVDPQEKPLEHCRVTGLGARVSYDRTDDVGPRVVVTSLGPDERRLLRIHHDEPDLGLAAFVSPGDASSGPRRLQLAPCATIVGRLIDQGGAPIADLTVRLMTLIPFDAITEVRTDAEGRFRFEHVASGIPVSVDALGTTLDPLHPIQAVVPEFEVVAGATKDAGDVRLKVR